jgi:hypothetical protein
MANSPDDRTPVPAGKGTPAGSSSRAEIDAFVRRVRAIERAQASTRGADFGCATSGVRAFCRALRLIRANNTAHHQR